MKSNLHRLCVFAAVAGVAACSGKAGPPGPPGAPVFDARTLPGTFYPESLNAAADGTLYVSSLTTGEIVASSTAWPHRRASTI
jgi:hypothetical protein